MQELTKALMSWSWALSLFGFKQMANMTMPREMSRPFDRATSGFDAVTKAACDQLDSTLKSAYEAGDRMQRSMVDMMLGFFSVDALNPNYWMRMGSDVMQRSAQAAGQLIPGGQAAARAAGSAAQAATSSASSAAGWIPIPRPPAGRGGSSAPGRSL